VAAISEVNTCHMDILCHDQKNNMVMILDPSKKNFVLPSYSYDVGRCQHHIIINDLYNSINYNLI